MSTRNHPWPWYAILTKSGREKNATLLLENSGFECYLPLSKSSRKWSDRTKEIDVPLFPGYLFCRMNPNDRLPVLITPGVVQIVGTGKTPIPIEEQGWLPRAGQCRADRRHPAGGQQRALHHALALLAGWPVGPDRSRAAARNERNRRQNQVGNEAGLIGPAVATLDCGGD